MLKLQLKFKQRSGGVISHFAHLKFLKQICRFHIINFKLFSTFYWVLLLFLFIIIFFIYFKNELNWVYHWRNRFFFFPKLISLASDQIKGGNKFLAVTAIPAIPAHIFWLHRFHFRQMQAAKYSIHH